MKKIILLCVIVIFAINCFAQQQNLLYMEAGAGGGTHVSFKFGLNYVFYESNVVSALLFSNFKNDPSVPGDYQRDLFGGRPKDYMTIGAFMYGKMLYSIDREVRYNLRGGLALGNVTTPVNFRKRYTYSYLFGSNYDYDQDTKNTAGVVLNPTIEFPFGRAFGLSVGLFSVISAEMSSFGVEGSMLIGRVRHKRAI